MMQNVPHAQLDLHSLQNERLRKKAGVAALLDIPASQRSSEQQSALDAIKQADSMVHVIGDTNTAQAELAQQGGPFDLVEYLARPGEFQAPTNAIERAQLVEALYEAVTGLAEARQSRKAGAAAAYDEAYDRIRYGDEDGNEEEAGRLAKERYLAANPAPDSTLATAAQDFVDEHGASVVGRIARNALFGIPEWISEKTGLQPESERRLADQIQNRFSPTIASLAEIGNDVIDLGIIGKGAHSGAKFIRRGRDSVVRAAPTAPPKPQPGTSHVQTVATRGASQPAARPTAQELMLSGFRPAASSKSGRSQSALPLERSPATASQSLSNIGAKAAKTKARGARSVNRSIGIRAKTAERSRKAKAERRAPTPGQNASNWKSAKSEALKAVSELRRLNQPKQSKGRQSFGRFDEKVRAQVKRIAEKYDLPEDSLYTKTRAAWAKKRRAASSK